MEENNNIEKEVEQLEVLEPEETLEPIMENVEPVQPEPAPQVPQEIINQMNSEPAPQIVETVNEPAPTMPQQPVVEPVQEEVVEPPMENIEETPTVETPVPPVMNNAEPVPPIMNNETSAEPVINNEVSAAPTEPAPPVQQPAFSMTPDPNVKLEEVEEKKKKSPKIFIIGAVAVVVIGVLFFLYNSVFQNKKVIVQKEITTIFDSFINTVKEIDKQTIDIDFDKDKVGVEGSLSISSNFKSQEIDLSKLKDYSFKYNGVIDKSSNKLSGSITLNKKDNPYLALNTFMNGKTLFLQSEELYSKVLKTTLDKEIKDYDFNSLEMNKITTLLEKTRDIVKNSVNEKDIKKSTVSKDINGKKQSVNKVSYSLNYVQLVKDIINGYIKDKEVLKILSDISGEEVDDIKESLQEELKYIDDSDEVIMIDSYHDKLTSSVKLIEISREGLVFSITKLNDLEKFSYKLDDQELLIGSYDKKKEELKFETTTEDNRMEFVLKKKKENSYSISMTAVIDESRYSLEATIDNKVTKDTIENNAEVTLHLDVDGEKISTEIKSTSKLSKAGTVKEINGASAVDVNSITEEDIYAIENNLLTKVQSILMDIMPGYFDSINMRLQDDF